MRDVLEQLHAEGKLVSFDVPDEYAELENELLSQLRSERYRRAYDGIKQAVESLWPSEGTRIVKRFTDHGILHSRRMLRWAKLLLNAHKGKYLCEEELLILLISILLHDTGMQCDIAKYPGIRDIALHYGADFDVDFTAADADSYSDSEQRAVRKNHHLIAAACFDYARSEKDGPLGNVVNLIPPDLIDDIRDVCKYHSSLPIDDCPVTSDIHKCIREAKNGCHSSLRG